MSFERFRDYTENFITVTALGAGVLTGITAVNPDCGAELRTLVHRAIDADFNTSFEALGEARQADYLGEIRNDLAEDKNIFGGLATISLLAFTDGVRKAKRRRESRNA